MRFRRKSGCVYSTRLLFHVFFPLFHAYLSDTTLYSPPCVISITTSRLPELEVETVFLQKEKTHHSVTNLSLIAFLQMFFKMITCGVSIAI